MADNQTGLQPIHVSLLKPADFNQLLQIIADKLLIFPYMLRQLLNAAVGAALQTVHIFTEPLHPAEHRGSLPGHNTGTAQNQGKNRNGYCHAGQPGAGNAHKRNYQYPQRRTSGHRKAHRRQRGASGLRPEGLGKQRMLHQAVLR